RTNDIRERLLEVLTDLALRGFEVISVNRRMMMKRERLEDTPRKSKSGFAYRARAKKAPKKIKRERLVIHEPASATFIELMQDIGSNNQTRRHRAARRLAAHCTVVFKA